jgi:hypothetical protein
LNVCVVFFAFFTHALTNRLLLTGPTPSRDLGARSKTAPASPLALPATVTVCCFRWNFNSAVARGWLPPQKGEASSIRQDDGQRFQKKAMKTTNQKIEASAPANVRPAESVSKRSKLPKLHFALRHKNRQLPPQNLLQLLQSEAPEFRQIAHVVGQWVWIQFRQKQPPTITSALSQFGFHWNQARKLWQHPCGVFCTGHADYDPRRRYGSHIPQAIA